MAPGGHRTPRKEGKHEEREAPLHLTALPSLRGSGSPPLPRLARGVLSSSFGHRTLRERLTLSPLTSPLPPSVPGYVLRLPLPHERPASLFPLAPAGSPRELAVRRCVSVWGFARKQGGLPCVPRPDREGKEPRGLQRWALWGAPAWGTSADWVVSGSPRRSPGRGCTEETPRLPSAVGDRPDSWVLCVAPQLGAPLPGTPGLRRLLGLQCSGTPSPGRFEPPFLPQARCPAPSPLLHPAPVLPAGLALPGLQEILISPDLESSGESTALAGKGLRWSPGHSFIRGPWAKPLPALSPFFSLICTESMSFSGGQEAL